MQFRREWVTRGMYVAVDREGRYWLYYDRDAWEFFGSWREDLRRVYKKDLPIRFEVYQDLSWYDI